MATLHQDLELLLLDAHREQGWSERIDRCAQRLHSVIEHDADALLYLLVQAATSSFEHYSSKHALLCAAVADHCAMQLQWSDKERASLRLAALTMNLSMTTLQNHLALQEFPLTSEQKRRVDQHAGLSAELLRAAGVCDDLWLFVVELHHQVPGAQLPLAELAPEDRLARVLRRIDVYTSKISPREGRSGLTAPLAARDACLGADGQPDEVGAVVVKVLGIYPPGTYVRLVSGEAAVVMRHGRRANQPLVAAIASRAGHALDAPALRDAADPAHAIQTALRTNEVRVRFDHERLLCLCRDMAAVHASAAAW
ncbi:hypothetical protein ASC87_00600 [Rhizobacter sp. Root1221]|nr:hypothetical protein ASC87_00600 [Rhizobacter sp. Root1221]